MLADPGQNDAEDYPHRIPTQTPCTPTWLTMHLQSPLTSRLASINDSMMSQSHGGEDEDDDEEEEKEGQAQGITKTQSTTEYTPMNIHKRKKRHKRRIWVNLTNCKYESVRRAVRRYGLKMAKEGDDWTLMWSDCSVSLERVKAMKHYQKINHFPGMIEICRKDTLARNLNRMLKLFPKDYKIFPRTWCLPADYCDLQAYTRIKKHATFICKPDTGSQGRGIFITRSSKDIQPGEHMICQLYISKGLARFCTTKYTEPTQSNMDEICMHLTNYSINKNKENFIRDDNTGSKRKLTTLIRQLEAVRADADKLWGDIEDMIIKTLIAVHPVLKHNYRTCFPNHTSASACFEILGFDVLLDHSLRPWLLEVNHSPSFTTDSPLDREVKDALLLDTLGIINLNACNRSKITKEERRRAKERLQENRSRAARSEELHQSQAASVKQTEKYESKNLGGFRKIFPREDGDNYTKFFRQESSLVQATEASRARQECARQQLQELREKQHPGTRNRFSQGETAGERSKRIKPRTAHHGAASTHTLSSVKICELEEEDEEKEEEARVNALIQRKKLLVDLGLAQHIRQLLHPEACDDMTPRQQGLPAAGKLSMLEPLTPFSEKTKELPYVLTCRQGLRRPSSKNFNPLASLQNDTEGRQHEAWTLGTIMIPGPGHCLPNVKIPDPRPLQDGVPLVKGISKRRSPCGQQDPVDLPGLLITSLCPPRLTRLPPLEDEGP
ncbi:tubulin polyglutamylase ttll6 isoform X2 [Corythoichthys intestinalis]|uniref:tubulin polyglutamylase ttll6 isoform X2 n=1 Tax=Corythoichthys intestinalis TaxID=161448 RepID=UPI0025A61B28|nr:tubulin polyglutamylase ttll6 isoform X2 [Corythoichthys intestinalis]